MKVSNHVIERHCNLFRWICLVLALVTLAALILTFAGMYPVWPVYLFVVLYSLSFTPLMTLTSNNRWDRVLYSMLVLLSLLICAGSVVEITNAVFHNTNINVYLGITAFFTFSYLYDMYFRETAKPSNITLPFLLLADIFQRFYAMSAQAAVGISKTCSIIRLVLLILSMFDGEYNLLNESIRNMPITEAIVTSLAVEKVIKSFYGKLGTRVEITDNETGNHTTKTE